MELRHLRSFIAAAEAEHFGRAAAALGISQPALSQQVAELERDLGVALFNRLPRGVRLSDPGRAFLDAAREALAVVAAGVERARDVGRGVAGRLTVGLPETAGAAARVRGALAAVRTAWPGVEVMASGLAALDQVPAVLDARLDAGFAWSPDPPGNAPGGVGPNAGQPNGWHPPGLASARAYADPVDRVLLPADHPLATHSAGRAITPAELRVLPFGLFERVRHPVLHDAVRTALTAAGAVDAVARGGIPRSGIPPAVTAGPDAAGLEMATATAAAGAPLLLATAGWTFVPRSVAADRPPGLASRRLRGVVLAGGFDVVWREDDRRPVCAALVAVLRRAFPAD